MLAFNGLCNISMTQFRTPVSTHPHDLYFERALTWVQAEQEAAHAEARADEAATVTDRLLREHHTEWMPHWLVYGYATVPPHHSV